MRGVQLVMFLAFGAAVQASERVLLPPVSHPTFQKGFTYAGWTAAAYTRPGARDSLVALAAAGVEWISLVTAWYQASRSATEIAPHASRTPTDDSLRVARRAGSGIESVSSIRLYTPSQMRRLCERAGLTVEAMYGHFLGEEYRRSSRRLIVVGRKDGRRPS